MDSDSHEEPQCNSIHKRVLRFALGIMRVIVMNNDMTNVKLLPSRFRAKQTDVHLLFKIQFTVENNTYKLHGKVCKVVIPYINECMF